MTERGLADKFLSLYPEAAARVLESHSEQSVAELFMASPIQVMIPVISRMLPSEAARSLSLLDASTAAALVCGMPPVAAVAVLRQLTPRRVSNILSKAPKTVALSLKLALGYPPTVVGAWMNPRAFRVAIDDDAGLAIERAREEHVVLDSQVYVINRDQKLCGVVRPDQLLRAEPATPVKSLIVPALHVLHSRSEVDAISSHKGWEGSELLAVINRDKCFVGTLHHVALRRALAHDHTAITQTNNESGQLIDAAWLSLTDMLEGSLRLFTARNSGKPNKD